MIYGVTEVENESVLEKVEEVLEEIGEKLLVKGVCRIGVRKPDTIRPVKFSLTCSDHVKQVLRCAKQLRTKEGFSTVYICPDRTVEERRAYKKLLDQLKEKKTSEPQRTHFIKNNKIVSSDT